VDTFATRDFNFRMRKYAQCGPRLIVYSDLYYNSLLLKCSERIDEDSCLDLAKRSIGGSFADKAVEDRVNMFKFALVMLLLVPVAFATTLPLIPTIPVRIHIFSYLPL